MSSEHSEHSDREPRAARVPPLLILGLGNQLLEDDGVGLALLDGLRAPLADDPRVELVDGGTQGLALLGLFDGRRALLVLDAVSTGAPPGTLHVSIDPLVLATARERGPCSAHAGSAGELLAAGVLLGVLPSSVQLVGLEPGSTHTRIGFSGHVRHALPAARECALAIARELAAQATRDEREGVASA